VAVIPWNVRRGVVMVSSPAQVGLPPETRVSGESSRRAGARQPTDI
jgi:hypothetical protein